MNNKSIIKPFKLATRFKIVFLIAEINNNNNNKKRR